MRTFVAVSFYRLIRACIDLITLYRLVELDYEPVTEILRHSAAVLCRITDYGILLREHLYI